MPDALGDDDTEDRLPRAVDLYRLIRRVVASVVVASRLATLGMVALSVIAGVQARAFTSAPVATITYVVLAVWSGAYILLVLRRDPVPDWVLAIDVLVTSAGMIALPAAARTPAFVELANSDLEPLTVAIAIAVALITASPWRTAAASAAMGLAFGVGQAHTVDTLPDLISIVSIITWQVGAGAVAYVFIRMLRDLARQVETATEQVVAARESVAARRANTEERMRHFREQVRRYRALHDGPLRVLRAIAGPGPAAHPDPAVRRQCAVSVNVLRGATPDDAHDTLTDLSLALIESGNDTAAFGLRVEYHFGNLPDDLPREVVEALSLAAGEALGNIVAHAGTSRARLTALAGGHPGRPSVTVAIVDQGIGFDPEQVPPGYGIRHSITGRMEEIGGVATIDSHPDQGTRVDLRWPR